MLNFLVLIIILFVSALLLSKKIREYSFWKATVTPLASIIGSGFLVIIPLLGHHFGGYAPLAVFIITLFAYAVGSSLRFNIQFSEALINEGKIPSLSLINRVSSLSLGIAYVISVVFYLRLLSSFTLHFIGYETDLYGKVLTTLILFAIGLCGLIKGLDVLEKLEEYSVSIKLAIITSLIIAWLYYDIDSHSMKDFFSALPKGFEPITSLRILAGSLIVVQGFEISRYLGGVYSQGTRIQSMKFAQIIASVIYVSFVTLTVPSFPLLSGEINDTAIIELSKVVAEILPLVLVVAAIMSQFSAAVADTIGAGGLMTENFHKAFNEKHSYAFVTILGVILVWLSNIFEIISLASRAFAFYYFLQSLVSIMTAHKLKQNLTSFKYMVLAFLLLGIVIFALPAAG